MDLELGNKVMRHSVTKCRFLVFRLDQAYQKALWADGLP